MILIDRIGPKIILGKKKKRKKGPSKKMFQGEKCSVCEDLGRIQIIYVL